MTAADATLEDVTVTENGSVSGKVLISCPVGGCDWKHQRVEPDPALVTLRPTRPPSLDFNAAFDAAVRQDDDACRAHLATHPVEDFLRTIADLRAQLAAAQPNRRVFRPGAYAVVGGQAYRMPAPEPVIPDPDGAIRAADGTLVAYLSQPGVSQQ